MTETSSDGGMTWSDDQPVQFASGQLNVTFPLSNFNSVSCSNSNCVAAGAYFDVAGRNQGMTETSTDGGLTGDLAQTVSFAAGVQYSTPSSFLNAVSCTGSTCVDVGGFVDADGNLEAMTQTSSNGGLNWANAEPPTFASGAQSASPTSEFATVSCAGSTCVVAGQYLDENGNAPTMTALSSDGGLTWSDAQPAVFASGVQSASPYALFQSSSCSRLTCVVGGGFTDVNGNLEAMTQAHLLASSTASVTNLEVLQSGTTLSASWSPSPGATSYTCTLLFGFSIPSTFTSTTTGTTCSFIGLSASTPYGVAVVASGPGGVSAPVSAFGAPSTTTTTTTIHNTPRPVERTIVCVRVKQITRIRGVHPRCPAGYKKK